MPGKLSSSSRMAEAGQRECPLGGGWAHRRGLLLSWRRRFLQASDIEMSPSGGWLVELSPGCAFFQMFSWLSAWVVWLQWRRCFAAASGVTVTRGARHGLVGEGCVPVGGAGVNRRRCGLHRVHICFLIGLFLFPLTPAFFFSIPSAHPV